MNNNKIFLGYLIAFLLFATGCVGRQQQRIVFPEVMVDENITYIEKTIERAGENLDDGDLQRARKLMDESLQKLFAVQGYISEKEYERLHSEIALLRLRTNHSVYSDVRVIESDLFPLVWNNKVDKWLNFYTTRGRDNFLIWLERKAKYIDNVRKVLKEHNLPLELAYVPIIESGFNPFARSPVGAVGLWQFMPETGKMFGLNVTHWYDERRDPYKTTIAAAQYLKKLYEEFGSWKLALAAYNMGRTALRRRIKRQKTNDFWELTLPRETENFVPKIMAAIFIATEPEIFGFKPSCMTKPVWKEFEVRDAFDLRKVAEWSGVNIREIQLLNPALRRLCTPPDVKYKLRIPYDSFDKFVNKYNSHAKNEKYLSDKEVAKRYTRTIFYRVRRGDNLWIIAEKFNVSVSKIKRWNNLRTSRIYPRQKLRIYRRGV